MIRAARFAMFATLVLAGTPAAGQARIDCQRCHDEPELLRQYVDTLERARAMAVRETMIDRSAHAGMGCSECHAGFTRFPHPAAASSRTCASCHEDVAAEWGAGMHADGADGEPVSCSTCHTVHDVLPTDSLRRGAGVRRMSETCAGCHETQRLPVDAHHQDHSGCYACHDPHGARSTSDPESWMAPANQARVCGACHDSVATLYSGGAHARALRSGDYAGGDPAAPSCTGCHGAHPVAGSGDVGAFVAALDRCASCHQDAARTYYTSYHGKAARLGSAAAATCADCHGAHGVEPASDPVSRVADVNLLETCGACHPYVRPAFVQYDAHPDPMNRERNPVLFYSFWFMNSLLIVTLTVFGLHTLLWWVRVTIDRRRGITHHAGGGGE